MTSLTADEVKAKSLAEVTGTLTPDQLTRLIDVTERIILGLGVNQHAKDYENTFKSAQLMLIDQFVSNPNFLKSLNQGQLQMVYSLEVPDMVRLVLRPILRGLEVEPRHHHGRY